MSEPQEVVCSFQPEEIRQYCCLDFDPSRRWTDEKHFPDLQLKKVLNGDERLSRLVDDLVWLKSVHRRRMLNRGEKN